MTADAFRAIALDLEGAVEASHMGHPDFRAAGRIFCSLMAGDEWAAVGLHPDEQQEFVRMQPDVFVPASGAWGRQGWTRIRLADADRSAVRGAVTLAWQHVVLRARPARRPASGARPARRIVRRRR